MTTGMRKAGDFCWINMLTPQPKQACEFFTAVLGWTYGEIPGLGYSIKVGGHDIGGLFDLAAPQTPPGTPPLIGVMLKVESADAFASKVASLGGKALPPFDILDHGRLAVCFDPNGANFDAWQAKKVLGTDVDSTQHGAPNWYETLTTDVDRAVSFYTQLLGWSAQVVPMDDSSYTVFKLGATPVAGMLAITPRMGAVKSHWRTYFTVKDADEAARKAVELGGAITMAMKGAPDGARFCELTSPQGVAFCVAQHAR